MSNNYGSLKILTDAELIRQHDNVAQHTVVGIQYYLDELRYREQSKITNQIWWFTMVVTFATLERCEV